MTDTPKTDEEIDVHNLLVAVFGRGERLPYSPERQERVAREDRITRQLIFSPELSNTTIARVCGCTPEEVEERRLFNERQSRMVDYLSGKSRWDKRRKAWRRKARASKKQKIPNDLRWAVWKRDDFTCQHCGKREHLSIDHIIPESQGGEMTMENLWTLCKPCNSEKGTRVYAYSTGVTLSG